MATARSVRQSIFETGLVVPSPESGAIHIGPLQLKGRVEPVRAFRILGEPEMLPERGVPGLSAPMVGREPELDLLTSLFERVRREGRPLCSTAWRSSRDSRERGTYGPRTAVPSVSVAPGGSGSISSSCPQRPP